MSILFKIEDDPEHPFSEAVGMLQRIDGEGRDSVLVIRKRDATVVEVPLAKVIRLKKIPSR